VIEELKQGAARQTWTGEDREEGVRMRKEEEGRGCGGDLRRSNLIY
jgi:hypothetical protein